MALAFSFRSGTPSRMQGRGAISFAVDSYLRQRVYPLTLNGKKMISTAPQIDDQSFKILNAEKQTGKVSELFLSTSHPTIGRSYLLT